MAREKLLKQLQEQLAFLRSEECLLLGISGGADSVALLHLLMELGYGNLQIVHFNHQLRGKESDGDALFVESLAQSLNLPYEIGHGDVALRATQERLSLETAARKARYEFFSEVAKKKNSSTILLAHHADDQLETIFFNFLRGSGSAGLVGMLPVSERTIGTTTLRIIRPLLTFPKKELVHYLDRKNLSFRHDASNDTLEATRNRLRHRLFPLIDEIFGVTYRSAITRTASILDEENNYLESVAGPFAEEIELKTSALTALPLALQRRVFHAWLRNQGFCDVGFAEVERVRSLLNLHGPAKINLPGNRHARRRAGMIFLE